MHIVTRFSLRRARQSASARSNKDQFSVLSLLNIKFHLLRDLPTYYTRTILSFLAS